MNRYLNVSRNPLKALKPTKLIWKILISTIPTSKTILITIFLTSCRKNIISYLKASSSHPPTSLHPIPIHMYPHMTLNFKKKH